MDDETRGVLLQLQLCNVWSCRSRR